MKRLFRLLVVALIAVALFSGCQKYDDSDLPATKVGYGSCFSMFDGCTSLRKAPALPAKQLDEFCYQQMFWGCTSLEEAPELPPCLFCFFPFDFCNDL